MTERYNGLSMLRGVAAFFIVGCHLALAPRTAGSELILHFCNMFVGVFGAISGFLLANSLEKNDGTLHFLLGKRATRLLRPYIVWSVLYVGASYCIGANAGSTARFLGWRLFDIVLRGGAACHLWYLISLLYISVILISVWQSLRRVRLLWVLLPFGFLCIFITTLDRSHFFLYELRLAGFVLIGAGLKNLCHYFETVSWRILLFIVCVAFLFHVGANGIHPFIKDAIVVVPLLLLCAKEWIPQMPVFITLDKISFGVFLVHPLITAAIAILVRKHFNVPFTAEVTLVVWVCAYCLAALSTIVLQRFAVTRRFV